MIWQNGELKSPFSGEPLEFDSAHSLSDGRERFPVVAGIPFLRAKRDELKNETLRALDANDERAALVLLLQDQDDWARSAPPTAADLQPLFDNEDLTLRDAMQCLRYGAVADYFAYRWSDPTFLSGLALLEWHLPVAKSQISNLKFQIFELCCGIGHYLREFNLRGIEATGADVVFSKLWLARKFVAPEAKLVCVDANFALPFAGKTFDAAFCHDAFYFLPEKQFVANELNRITNGAIIIGHAHNRDADNFSSGAAISVNEYAEIVRTACGSGRSLSCVKDRPLPQAVLTEQRPTAVASGSDFFYDDAELTRSIIENRQPNARTTNDLRKIEAISIAANVTDAAKSGAQFDLPILGQSLRINPLLDAGKYKVLSAPEYPSERYADEYSKLSDYLILGDEQISFADQKTAFYGHWEKEPRLTDLARRRIFVDLPEDW